MKWSVIRRCGHEGKIEPCLHSSDSNLMSQSQGTNHHCGREGKIEPCLHSGNLGGSSDNKALSA